MCEFHLHIPHSLQCRHVGPSFLGLPLLISSCLDFGGRGPALPFSSSSLQALQSFLPPRVGRRVTPRLHSKHVAPLPLPEHTKHCLPRWLRNRCPLCDRAQLAFSCLPHTSSSTFYRVAFLVSWTHVPFAFLPACLCSSRSFRLEHFLYGPHLHLLMSCP